jgi:hypothetical protein
MRNMCGPPVVKNRQTSSPAGARKEMLSQVVLPTPEQANVIRDILGIHKRREVSTAELERLKAFAFAKKPRCEASSEQNIALSDRRLPDSRPGSNADFIPASAPAARA